MHNLYLKHISVWTVSSTPVGSDSVWMRPGQQYNLRFSRILNVYQNQEPTIHTFVNNLLLNSLQIALLENTVYLMFVLSPGWDYEGNLGGLPALWEHPVSSRRHPGQHAIML